jgi:hypothetical protein
MFAMVELRRCETFLVERSALQCRCLASKCADPGWVSAPTSFTTRLLHLARLPASSVQASATIHRRPLNLSFHISYSCCFHHVVFVTLPSLVVLHILKFQIRQTRLNLELYQFSSTHTQLKTPALVSPSHFTSLPGYSSSTSQIDHIFYLPGVRKQHPSWGSGTTIFRETIPQPISTFLPYFLRLIWKILGSRIGPLKTPKIYLWRITMTLA